jgi:predicted nucleic acid-binding protein
VLIAATAAANRAILVTHNIKEFGRIKQLQIEDRY